jgi:hypothetical protein
LPIENILLDAELIVRESARAPRQVAVDRTWESSQPGNSVHHTQQRA